MSIATRRPRIDVVAMGTLMAAMVLGFAAYFSA